MNIITSSKNPLIKSMKELSATRGRESANMFLVEGEVMIKEAIRCGLKLHDIIATEKKIDTALEISKDAIQVTDAVLQAACDTKTPQGMCATFDMPSPLPLENLPDRIVALDGVQDPGNVGTIWRTADAAGFEAMLLGAGSADPMSPKVQRSAMGSGFRVPISKAASLPEALAALAAKGYSIICSDLHGKDFYSRPDPGKKFVLVIGNEARGISDETRAQATMLVKLPMRGGAESLNAAVAAGIMMYELMR